LKDASLSVKGTGFSPFIDDREIVPGFTCRGKNSCETAAKRQGTTSVVPNSQQNRPGFSPFLDDREIVSGFTCREKNSCEAATKRQGTTSVVPKSQQNRPGFSPCG
jgi:hypothetical protein